ncbi:aspartate 1-decarboxylase [Legionella yabuuchiae]|uniref:aspartate 1-decarboxylase n=1 Tax=Legionella yabuuchiae TaxID=376727 RepID=UPI001054EDEE|nr:aspartate 1-decarboxylase [Legionella yabuuchiae]
MIYRKMLKSKIHRATVTEACLDYEGSITLAPELLVAANILPNEAVNVWNVTAGTRFETYTIEGPAQSLDVCVNGAAAHLVTPGDIIIIASFIQLVDESCYSFKPTVVFVDEQNQLKEVRPELVRLNSTAIKE